MCVCVCVCVCERDCCVSGSFFYNVLCICCTCVCMEVTPCTFIFTINSITKYGSTLYIGMDEVFQHHAHTFEKSNLNFHFQCEFSSVTAEW